MPADDGTLGVLLVSFSSVADQAHQRTMYAPALRAHPALRLIAVADEADAPPEQHALNAREAEALALPYIPELDRALSDPRVDVVSVCCPFARRVAVLERVAAAGKHAIVDKPMALTLDDCAAIARAFGSPLVCMPAHHYRFMPAIRSARNAVVGGTIGLPWAVHAEFVIGAGTAAWPLGELLNFGLYSIDAMRAVLGVEARTVYATRGAFFYAGEADDFSVLALGFEHGIIATTSVGRAPTPGQAGAHSDRRMRVMGSHGTIVVDAAAPALTVNGARTEQRFFGVPSLRAFVDHFVAAVRGEQTPELGPRDARAALDIVLAAQISAADNRVVTLDGDS